MHSLRALQGLWLCLERLDPLPAVVDITNVPRFIACFKAALQTASAGESVSWPARLPAATRLKPSQFYDVVQRALQSPMHTVPEGLLKAVTREGKPDPRLGPNWADEPAAHVWDAAQVQELMTLAASVDKGTSVDWQTITMLAKCPAAHKVTPQALTVILQRLLSSLDSDDHANRKLNRREHMLQQCVAALSLVARDRDVFVRQMGFASSGGIQLASVHKEALLCLAALRPIRDVQPEQLPQAESGGVKATYLGCSHVHPYTAACSPAVERGVRATGPWASARQRPARSCLKGRAQRQRAAALPFHQPGEAPSSTEGLSR